MTYSGDGGLLLLLLHCGEAERIFGVDSIERWRVRL